MRKSARDLVDDACGPDAKRRKRARLALEELSAEDASMHPDLLVSLDDADDKRRFWAMIGLRRLASLGVGDAARTAARICAIATSDPAFGNREHALVALPHFSSHLDLTLPVIVDRLRTDSDWSVRAEACRALGYLGIAAAGTAGVLVAALRDDDPSVRSAASISLKFVPVSSGSAEACAILEAAKTHKDDGVRSQLVTAAKRFQPGGHD